MKRDRNFRSSIRVNDITFILLMKTFINPEVTSEDKKSTES